MSKKHTRKLTGFVKTLESQKNKQSRMHIMMSEFIDNSYSSWIIDGRNNNLNNLHIELEFNYLNDFIEIRDNAYGMNIDSLSNALIMFNDRNEKDNYINIFGVGMKQAAFWLGGRLEITTHDGNGTQHYTCLDLDELKEIEDETESVDYDIFDVPQTIDRGTIVRISKIHPRIKDYKLRVFFKEVIGWRFNKQLNLGMSISMKVVKSKKQSNSEYIPIQSFYPKGDRVQDWGNLRTFYPSISENWMLDLFKQIEALYHEGLISKSLLDDVKIKIQNNSPLVFDSYIHIDNQVINGQIGLLSFQYNQHLNSAIVGNFKIKQWRYSTMKGFTLYQSNRGIIGGPNDNGIYAYHAKQLNGGGGEKFRTRFFGHYDLTGIFDVDENKRGFQWVDADPKKIQFDTQLQNEIKKYLNLFRVINKFERQIISATVNNTSSFIKDGERIISSQNDIFDKHQYEKIEILTDDDEPGILYKNFQLSGHTINIKLIEIEKGSTFVTSSQNEDGLYILRVNIKHDLFKNSLISTYGKSVRYELVYPLVVLIGLADLVITDEFPELQAENFTEALNQISEIVWIDERIE